MDKDMLNKKLFSEIKLTTEAINEEKYELSGVAVQLGTRSRNNVIYENLTFAEETLPFLNGHIATDVLGKVSFQRNGSTINFKAKLNPKISNAMRYWENIKHGDITKVSIGVISSDVIYDDDREAIVVRQGELVELSLVAVPGFNDAKITNFENYQTKENKEVKMDLNTISMSELNERINFNEKNIAIFEEGYKKLNETLEVETDDIKASALIKEIKSKEESLNSTRAELDAQINARVERLNKLNEIKSKIEKEKVMDKTKKEEISKDLINLRNQNYGLNEYLASKQAYYEFQQTIIKEANNPANRGDRGSINPSKAWSERLIELGYSLTEAITGANSLFPKNTIADITDCMVNVGYLMPFIEKQYGFSEWTFVFNSNEELGYGDNRADKYVDKKIDQNMSLVEKKINTDYVYKKITVPRSMLDQPNNVLYNYIMRELAQRLIKTIERAIVVGDGLVATDSKKIKEIIPMKDNTWTEFVSSITIAEINPDILDDVDCELLGDGPTIFIANKKTLNEIKKQRTTTGERVYERGTITYEGRNYLTLDGMIMVEGDYLPPYVKGTAQTGLMFAIKLNSYLLVSYRQQAEMFTDFHLSTNTNEFLTEARLGGNAHKCNGIVQVNYTPVVAP